MKKTVLSVMLLLAMLVSMMAPMGVSAATADLKSFLESNGISAVISANKLDDIVVPANIQLKKSGAGEYADDDIVLSVTTKKAENFPKFDFRAELDMSPVSAAFARYYKSATELIKAKATDDTQKDSLLADLAAVPVTGEFKVVVDYSEGLTIPAEFVNGTDMYGFSCGTEGIFEEDSRVDEANGANWRKLTITVKVKDGVKGGDINANLDTYLGNLSLECTGVAPAETDKSYKVNGSVTGNTVIGGADEIVDIKYNADQKDSDATAIALDERIAALKFVAYSSGGSGGRREQKFTVTFDVDGDKAVVGSLTLKSGETVDFDALEAPVKEGYIFDGFYYDAQLKNKVTGKVKITKNTVFYGTWVEKGSEVAIVVDINGKTDEVEAFVYPVGTVVNFDTLKQPTKAGYVFDGYYLDKDFTTKATGEFTIMDEMILFGRWLKAEAPGMLTSDKHLAYIAGYPDGTIRPNDHISREEVATIFYRIMNEENRNAFYKDTNIFPDVDDDRWSNEAVSTMANAKYVIGYEDGTFRPADNITRAEFVTIVARLNSEIIEVGTPYNDIAGHWAEKYIITASKQGWIDGYSDGSFRPDEYITRADVIRIINRLLVRSVNAEGLHADATKWDDVDASNEYYYDILEATNSHDFDRQEDGYHETWKAILEESFIIDELNYED